MLIIAPKSARAVTVRRGQLLRIEDLDGSQVADFVCFRETDHGERFSQSKTRVRNWSIRISTGSQLVSNRDNVMFTIVEDRVGVHDILFCQCHSYVYEHMFELGPRDGCLENLAAALGPHGLSKDDVPDPFNVFMNTGMREDGTLFVAKTPSRQGDHVLLRAEMDCLVAVSACADDHTECNGGTCTRIGLEIRDP